MYLVAKLMFRIANGFNIFIQLACCEVHSDQHRISGAVRSLLRHRDNLVKSASSHIQHIHKSLTQMNLQIHNVISDITGVTGMAIIDAILAGERNPNKLAELKDRRIKATKQTIVKSLTGDYRREHLFTLEQTVQSYRNYRQLIMDCDVEIEKPPEGI